VESLADFEPVEYVATIYKENVSDDKINLSTEELRKEWIKAWMAEA